MQSGGLLSEGTLGLQQRMPKTEKRSKSSVSKEQSIQVRYCGCECHTHAVGMIATAAGPQKDVL